MDANAAHAGPTRKRLLRTILIAVAAIAVTGSVTANIVLCGYVWDLYAELQQLALDPTMSAHFAARNAGLGPPRADRPRIVFYGDSRIDRWSPLPEVDGAEIVNQGFGGNTTNQLLLRLDRDVLALKPSIVVLQGGINDLKAIPVLSDSKGIRDACQANLNQVIERLQTAGIHVVVLTILPAGPVSWTRLPAWSDDVRTATAEINAKLEARAGAGVTVVNCDATMGSRVGTHQHLRFEFARDALHLNEAGYRQLNTIVAPVLRRLVK